MNKIIYFDKFPPIDEMIRQLIPILIVVKDMYIKRKLSRMVRRSAHTMFDYVFVCTYYHLFVVEELYSMMPDKEAKYKRQRNARRLEYEYHLGDMVKKREMGIDAVYYKDQLITNDLENEDCIRLMVSLYLSIKSIRKVIIKDIGEVYELTRKTD